MTTTFPTSLSHVPSALTAHQLIVQQYRSMEVVSPELDAAFKLVARALQEQHQMQVQQTRMVDALVPNQGGAVYRSDINAFVTQGYTSQAGNSYFDVIRVSSAVVTKVDVGIGYAHTFCNAISLYSADGKKTLLRRRFFHNYRPSEAGVRNVMIDMATEYLVEQLPAERQLEYQPKCRSIAASMIDSTVSVKQTLALQQIMLSLQSG